MFKRIGQGQAALRQRLNYTGANLGVDLNAFLPWLAHAFQFNPDKPPVTLGKADALVPWLALQWKRNPRISAQKVRPIVDWWVGTRLDIGQFTFAQADAAQQAWHEQMIKEMKQVEIERAARGKVVLSFPNGCAWHVVRKGTTDHNALRVLRSVGKSLGHCYSDHPCGGVLAEYLSQYDMYVLYDPWGEPHVTVATTPDGTVAEARVAQNLEISVESPWAAYVVSLVEAHLKWSAALVPLAPPAILVQLAGDSDWHVRVRVARNPSAPLGILVQLAGDIDCYVHEAVAKNPSTPREILAQLAGDGDVDVRRAVAKHPSTPPAALAQLAGDSDWHVQTAVAQNPSAPPAALVQLAGTSSWWLRKAVAKHPSTPSATLAQLAEDSDVDVRRAVARNPSTQDR